MGGIGISTEVVVEDKSQGVLVSSQMTAENINTQMSKSGLPEVEILQTPEVAVVQLVVVASSVTTSASKFTPVPSSALASTELGSTPAPPSTESEQNRDYLQHIQSKGIAEGWKIGIIIGAMCFMIILVVPILVIYKRGSRKVGSPSDTGDHNISNSTESHLHLRSQESNQANEPMMLRKCRQK